VGRIGRVVKRIAANEEGFKVYRVLLISHDNVRRGWQLKETTSRRPFPKIELKAQSVSNLIDAPLVSN
jgi:hypothetical protein